MDTLTLEQIDALKRFKASYGRTWKSQLNTLWFSGRDERQADAGLLRQVRNSIGPSGLLKVKI